MRSRISIVTLLLTICIMPTISASPKVEPSFWWAQMPMKELQLQIYGPSLGTYKATIDHPEIQLIQQTTVDSPNYLFVDLEISTDAKPGTFIIKLSNDIEQHEIEYTLLERDRSDDRIQGFDSSDLIYLMMPDRFANGDPNNDSFPWMREKADTSDPARRQGGDLKGIEENLKYFEDLGVTALWFTPVIENDMPKEYGAYHGYAATDLYKIDPRFGTNEQYKAFIKTAHQRGIKIIMDMIHNHIGLEHWWMKDLPTKDWIHSLEKEGITNYHGTPAVDPYASQHDKDKLIKGWFVNNMPDLDQRNELLAKYLIQNTIWWIEYSGIDGIRMDTYHYPYADYMARWCKEVRQAYPTINLVGEAWVNEVAHEAHWQEDSKGEDDGYNSYLPSVIDFPLSFAIRDALEESDLKERKIDKVYNTLSQDYLYSAPEKNVVFLDSHDVSRIFENVGNDESFFKIAFSFLMTTRGIPQMYYGSELMFSHTKEGRHDQQWRQKMPGGWPGDKRSVFEESSRTEQENRGINFISKLANWRKKSPAIHTGKYLHFIPDENTYVYFRLHDEQTVMVILNVNEQPHTLDQSRYHEVLKDFSSAFDVVTENKFRLNQSPITISGKSSMILELN